MYEQYRRRHEGNLVHKIIEDVFATKNLLLIDHHPLLVSLDNDILHECIRWFFATEFTKRILAAKYMCEVGFADIDGKIGRIDLLCFFESHICIADYKTGTHASMEQLKFYKNTIQSMYPNRIVKLQLVWLTKKEIVNID